MQKIATVFSAGYNAVMPDTVDNSNSPKPGKWPAIIFLLILAWWLRPASAPVENKKLPDGWQHFFYADQIRAMICERSNLWIGGLSGLRQLQWRTASDTTSLLSKPPVPLARIEAMVLADDGRIFIGHDRGLLSLDRKGNWQNLTHQLPDPKILSLCISREGELWAGTWRGLAIIDNSGKSRHLGVADGLPAEKIRTIFLDSLGGIWIGTHSPPGGGLIRWSGGPRVLYTTADILAHPSVTAMYEDSSGTLWIGTGFFDQGGTTRFSGWQSNDASSAVIMQQKDGLAGNKGRSIFQDSGKNIWIGSELDGLTIIRPDGRKKIVTRNDGLIGDEVMCIAEDPDGNIWLGQEMGLCRIASAALPVLLNNP